MRNSIRNYIGSALFFKIMSMLAGFGKFSFIVGSTHAFFSLAGAITPLSGELMGNGGSIAFFLLNFMLYSIFKGSFAWHYFAYFVPGLFAAFYWNNTSKVVRILPAALCMILFITHPIGSAAALYSLFWLIPMAIAMRHQQSDFLRALGSTFTAHAVGSVIWLYTLNMGAHQWLMLMPVVMIERVLLAISTVGVYRVLCLVRDKAPSWVGYRTCTQS